MKVNKTKGFTLVELLASTVLMSLIVVVVVAPLTNLFKTTSVSTRRLQESTQTQNILEFVKGQWKSYPRTLDDSLAPTATNYRMDLNRLLRFEGRRRYDTNCYDATGLNVPTGTTYTVTTNIVNRDGSVGEAQTLNSTCSSATVDTNVIPPPMKLITVTVTGLQNRQTVLSSVVARP